MSGASTIRRCWIIIPRFADYDAWRSAVKDAASKQGLQIINVSGDGPGQAEGEVFLADDANLLVHAASDDRVVLLLTSGALQPPSWQDGADHRHGHVRRLTDQICRAMSGRAAELKLASMRPGASLELFPGLTLVEPGHRSVSGFEPALTVFTEGRALWPADLFTMDERHVRSGGSEALNVTGRPRFLVFGPYFTLPAGRWRASFRLSFDEAASRMNYWLDWGGVENYSRAQARPGRPGVYEISIEHEAERDEPFELRVILIEGAFHGTVVFDGAEIQRIS